VGNRTENRDVDVIGNGETGETGRRPTFLYLDVIFVMLLDGTLLSGIMEFHPSSVPSFRQPSALIVRVLVEKYKYKLPVLSLFETFRIFTTLSRFLGTAASKWQVRRVVHIR
jgi:hypothetical protein